MCCCFPVVWASEPMYDGKSPHFMLLAPSRSVITSSKAVSSSVSRLKSGVVSVVVLRAEHDSILTFPYWPFWE